MFELLPVRHESFGKRLNVYPQEELVVTVLNFLTWPSCSQLPSTDH